MNKKLYVPDRLLAKKQINPTPSLITKGFKNEEPNKNEDDPSKIDSSVLTRLPTPTGYRLLVIPYYPKEKTKGGVYIPDATRERESFATVVAYVVKLGPDAYKDEDKFPHGAYCTEKEWVLMGRYAGNRFKVEGLELRIINDDNIIAKILDPTDISYV
jgi:co-chaperonin GroES (HSP10)